MYPYSEVVNRKFHFAVGVPSINIQKKISPSQLTRSVYYTYMYTIHVQMRQKYKKTFRKQSVTPTSTTAPSFPPVPLSLSGGISSTPPPAPSSRPHPPPTLPTITPLHSSTKDTTKPTKVCVCVCMCVFACACRRGVVCERRRVGGRRRCNRQSEKEGGERVTCISLVL